jgi:linoleate 10R-lipoxygenase
MSDLRVDLFYMQNSVYGVFPFFTPKKMKQSLLEQGIASQYTFERPVEPATPKVDKNLTTIKHMSDNPSSSGAIRHLNQTVGDGDYGFVLSFDVMKRCAGNSKDLSFYID